MQTLDYQTPQEPEQPQPESSVPFWVCFVAAFLFACLIAENMETIRQENRGHLNNDGPTAPLIVFVLPASVMLITLIKHRWRGLKKIRFAVLFGFAAPMLAYGGFLLALSK